MVKVGARAGCWLPANAERSSALTHVLQHSTSAVTGRPGSCCTAALWSRGRLSRRGWVAPGQAQMGKGALGCGTTCASGSRWESKEHMEIAALPGTQPQEQGRNRACRRFPTTLPNHSLPLCLPLIAPEISACREPPLRLLPRGAFRPKRPRRFSPAAWGHVGEAGQTSRPMRNWTRRDPLGLSN